MRQNFKEETSSEIVSRKESIDALNTILAFRENLHEGIGIMFEAPNMSQLDNKILTNIMRADK